MCVYLFDDERSYGQERPIKGSACVFPFLNIISINCNRWSTWGPVLIVVYVTSSLHSVKIKALKRILHCSNTLIGSGHKEIIVWFSEVFNLKRDSYLCLCYNKELKDRKPSQKVLDILKYSHIQWNWYAHWQLFLAADSLTYFKYRFIHCDFKYLKV